MTILKENLQEETSFDKIFREGPLDSLERASGTEKLIQKCRSGEEARQVLDSKADASRPTLPEAGRLRTKQGEAALESDEGSQAGRDVHGLINW